MALNVWRIYEVLNEVKDLGGSNATPRAAYPLSYDPNRASAEWERNKIVLLDFQKPFNPIPEYKRVYEKRSGAEARLSEPSFSPKKLAKFRLVAVIEHCPKLGEVRLGRLEPPTFLTPKENGRF